MNRNEMVWKLRTVRAELLRKQQEGIVKTGRQREMILEVLAALENPIECSKCGSMYVKVGNVLHCDCEPWKVPIVELRKGEQEMDKPVVEVTAVGAVKEEVELEAEQEFVSEDVVFRGYCMKCKETKEEVPGYTHLTAKGRMQFRGECPDCSAKIVRFGKK